MNDMRHGEAATNAIQLEKLIEKQILNKISIPTDHKTPSSKGSWLSGYPNGYLEAEITEKKT